MTNYNPIYKPNQLTVGSGQTAIITGWTVKSVIANKLNKTDYAVIGQLYSPTRGINYLIRNLLANPTVLYLLVLNATKEDDNAGGCKCLVDFFNNGVELGTSDTGKECWIIKSPIKGYIDREIDIDSLNELRDSICIFYFDNVNNLLESAFYLAKSPSLVTCRQAKEFPLVETLPTVLPGDRYGHVIKSNTIAEAWVKVIHLIKTTGVIRPTVHDTQWQELIDVMVVINNEPSDYYLPNYLPISEEFLNSYISQILDDAPYVEGVKYTYGQRLRSWFGKDQIVDIITKLIQDINTARCVMSLWDSRNEDKDNPPCLNHIWVRAIENELSLTATFRSNDMFAAWPANALGLRALQQHIVNEINNRSNHKLTMGPLITISQSAHIYSDCWENADLVIKKYYEKIVNNELKQYSDPVGNYIIETTNNDGDDSLVNSSNKTIIQVSRTTPGSGEVIECYSGTNPLLITKNICNDAPGISSYHASYLGIELQKAKQLGLNYIQDR